MKHILVILLGISLFVVGCEKNSKDSENDKNTETYSTVNVKNGTEYFNFAENSGSANAASAHDIVFYSELFQPPGMPFPISDPRFRVKDGLSAAVVQAESLDDVNEVPTNGEFITNFTSEFGEWYNTTDANLVVPQEKVYIMLDIQYQLNKYYLLYKIHFLI